MERIYTFVYVYNIGMLYWAHNLHLTPNADQIRLGLNFAFLYRFDGNLLACFLVNTKLHLAISALT